MKESVIDVQSVIYMLKMAKLRKYVCVICGKKRETTHYCKKTCSIKCSDELEKKLVRRWHKSPKGREYVRNKMREYSRSEKGRKKHIEYTKSHRKEINAWRKNYFKKTSKYKEYIKNYNKKNRERINAYHREWRKRKNETTRTDKKS